MGLIRHLIKGERRRERRESEKERKGEGQRKGEREKANPKFYLNRNTYSSGKKQLLVSGTKLFVASIVSSWLLTSKLRVQEGLDILQVGNCLAVLQFSV